MKRLITYCLLAVALLTGITTTTVCRSEALNSKTGLSNHNQQSLPDQQQSSFTANDLFCSIGTGSEHSSRLTYSYQYLSFRTLSSLSDASRIHHSIQLTRQQFSAGITAFLLKSAFKQSDGYYLYHLRKLLI
jgi:hypothetical protein